MHNFTNTVLWVYIILLLVGGLIGFFKANSKVSLISSSVFAALLILTAVPGVFQPALARGLANVILAALLVVFAVRLSKTKKFMPNGLMLAGTIVALALRNIVIDKSEIVSIAVMAVAIGVGVAIFANSKNSTRVYKFVYVGLLLGAVIGFLLRPSAAMGGQLPLSIVLTRGVYLEGLDSILVPAARTSFNFVLAGVILGAIAGYLLSKFMAKK